MDLSLLADLPHLQKLHKWNPYGNYGLSLLSRLEDLAVLGCDDLCTEDVNELVSLGKLEQLQVPTPTLSCQIRLATAQAASSLHTLIVSCFSSLPQGIEGCFARLKVLALFHADREFFTLARHLTDMTALEALSFAGSSIHMADDEFDQVGLCIRHLAPLSNLR